MIYRVTENRPLTSKTWLMRLAGDTGAITAPGQFVNLAVDGCYLRRPISVCDWKEGELTIAYDVVGRGTKIMSEAQPGHEFDTLNGLGNGFDSAASSATPLLVGGGIGIAPLVGLARVLVEQGKNPVAILGYNSADQIMLRNFFDDLGVETIVSTADGSEGIRGFVTDAIRESGIEFDYFYGCGPMPMLKALAQQVEKPGELSLDVRMACGFGACMCCSLETVDGPVCVCRQGPVFKKEILIWK